ncbi:uncharacterized protein [Chiloscyllium punctatum]|uniref:uncharacterized protein isoform X2 n=1 Tax=Chiloscyllium punctatum TaxID=137246 RepID=UPI003B6336C0
MDGEGSNLPENQDTDRVAAEGGEKPLQSDLFRGQTEEDQAGQISPSPSDQPTDDGANKGIRAIPEQRKDATVCSDCLPQPSNETPKEGSCIHSSPLQSSSDSKKSKFACQSASSQVHSKNTEGACSTGPNLRFGLETSNPNRWVKVIFKPGLAASTCIKNSGMDLNGDVLFAVLSEGSQLGQRKERICNFFCLLWLLVS